MNRMKALGLALIAIFVLLMTGSPLLAQETGRQAAAFYGPAMGAGLGAGLTMIGAAMGFGRIGAAALESMARQPETAGRVQTAMIIIGALLEGATFFALVVCFMLTQAPTL